MYEGQPGRPEHTCSCALSPPALLSCLPLLPACTPYMHNLHARTRSHPPTASLLTPTSPRAPAARRASPATSAARRCAGRLLLLTQYLQMQPRMRPCFCRSVNSNNPLLLRCAAHTTETCDLPNANTHNSHKTQWASNEACCPPRAAPLASRAAARMCRRPPAGSPTLTHRAAPASKRPTSRAAAGVGVRWPVALLTACLADSRGACGCLAHSLAAARGRCLCLML